MLETFVKPRFARQATNSLFAVFAIWMDSYFFYFVLAEQMHRVRNHYSPFVQMAFIVAVALAYTVSRRSLCGDQVTKV